MRCEHGCKFWSDLIAKAGGATPTGALQALCLNTASAKHMQYTYGGDGCAEGEPGRPIDEPDDHCRDGDAYRAPIAPTDAEIDRALDRMDHLFGPGWLEDKTFNAEVQAISALVTAMRPLLAGHSPGVQSGALADCLALWLAGHQIPGDEAATRTLRADLLAKHCSLVSDLVPLNAKQLGTQE